MKKTVLLVSIAFLSVSSVLASEKLQCKSWVRGVTLMDMPEHHYFASSAKMGGCPTQIARTGDKDKNDQSTIYQIYELEKSDESGWCHFYPRKGNAAVPGVFCKRDQEL